MTDVLNFILIRLRRAVYLFFYTSCHLFSLPVGPSLGFGNLPAKKTTPILPRQLESQNPGFTLPNFKSSPSIPGLGSLGEINSVAENGNSMLRPDAPPFHPGRPGERNHKGPFDPPAPQRLLQPNSFKQEPGQRPFDGPQRDPFGHGQLRGDGRRQGPGRDSWDERRGPPGDFKPTNWHDQGPNNLGRGRDFRGPPGDRFNGPQGILGSPPRNLEIDSRPGLLGPVPQQPQQLMQGSGGPQAGPNSQGGAPRGDDFPFQGRRINPHTVGGGMCKTSDFQCFRSVQVILSEVKPLVRPFISPQSGPSLPLLSHLLVCDVFL